MLEAWLEGNLGTRSSKGGGQLGDRRAPSEKGSLLTRMPPSAQIARAALVYVG
jgi:hypothetical protein